MILLQKDTINTCVFSLAEKTTITASTPYYLFSFVNQESNEQTLFTGVDLSTCSNRYNKFDITVSAGTEVLTASTINIEYGMYDYTVYSMTGQTNLDITGTTETVEVGLAYVSGSTSATTYTTADNNIKTIYYES